MNWRILAGGILVIVLVGVGGFLYRSVLERPTGPVACTTDAKVCPDGTALGRTGPGCTFPACPPPNVDLPSAGLAFALPAGYASTTLPDADAVAAFTKTDASGLESTLVIRQFTLAGSTTPADFVRSNAILDPSGMPAPATAFSSVDSKGRTFSVVQIGRFEGVVDTAYYLPHGESVLRFDALSRNVTNWTDPSFDPAALPANQDLKALLGTLEGD